MDKAGGTGQGAPHLQPLRVRPHRDEERVVNLRATDIEKALSLLSVASPAPIARQGQGTRWLRTAVAYRTVEMDLAQEAFSSPVAGRSRR